MRTAAALVLASGLLGGCLTTGGWPQGADSGSGTRWNGPYGGGPFATSPYGYRGDPFGDRSGGRTYRPARGVVCDRATETCYRNGEIDASDTREYFGKGAARRVDRIRDEAGTNRIYRADDDVVCNRRTQVCLKNGRPDRSETRDFFGKKAARRID